MRILSAIHLYPPKHNCGSEYMLHGIHKYLQSKGHEVRVLLLTAKTYNIKQPYTFDGVDVVLPSGSLDQYRWADVIMTHLDFTHKIVAIGSMVKKPVVYYAHGDFPYESIINGTGKINVVYNSEWVGKKLNYKWPSMVMRPPCKMEHYNVCENPIFNEYITLISLNENKGGNQFYDLAKAMPDKKFLGVKGSYDEQIIKQLPNVVIVENTPDILSIYKETRILLMPSKYESWGRTATEAMCNGIPVICTPTPGLMENCGDTAIYINDREDISKWVEAIRKLDDEKTYLKYSKRCRKRANELNPTNELEQLEHFIMNAAK